MSLIWRQHGTPSSSGLSIIIAECLHLSVSVSFIVSTVCLINRYSERQSMPKLGSLCSVGFHSGWFQHEEESENLDAIWSTHQQVSGASIKVSVKLLGAARKWEREIREAESNTWNMRKQIICCWRVKKNKREAIIHMKALREDHWVMKKWGWGGRSRGRIIKSVRGRMMMHLKGEIGESEELISDQEEHLWHGGVGGRAESQ